MTGQSYTRDPRFVAQKAETFNACQRGRFFRRLDPTFALGKKQTLSGVRSMSALPPKADITERDWNVCFVPKADIGAVTRSPRRLWRAATATHLNRGFSQSLG